MNLGNRLLSGGTGVGPHQQPQDRGSHHAGMMAAMVGGHLGLTGEYRAVGITLVVVFNGKRNSSTLSG